MKPFVLDTHFHVWDSSRIRYPWVADAQDEPQWFLGDRRLPLEYSLTDYAAEWAKFGVRPFVHIEAGAAPGSSLAETESLLGQPRGEHPLVLIVGADLEQDNLADELAAQCEHPEVVGVRQIVTWHPDPSRSFVPEDLLSRPRWRDGLRVLERLGLGFDLQIYPAQAWAAAEVAGMFPSMRFVLNHTMLPNLEDEQELAFWRSGLAILARHENVAVKVGGFSMTNKRLTPVRVESAIVDVLDAFGPSRVMIGTNAPVESTRNAPELFMEALWSALRSVSQTEMDAITSGNASEWYGVRRS